MIILISAKQGAGKTTLADGIENALPDTARTKFARVLYEMHDAVLAILRRYGYTDVLDKDLLQVLGTQWGRKKDMNIWVNCAVGDVDYALKKTWKHVALCDMRFKNEFEAFDGPEVVKIRLECPEEVRKSRCSQWRENTTHQSEIDLDDWVDRFDLVINTEKTTKEETLRLTLECINERISNNTRISDELNANTGRGEEGVESAL